LQIACPRDHTELSVDHHLGIEVDRCPTCHGIWLDKHELDALEEAHADENTRTGMIDYARRRSKLKCPKCHKTMEAFNYRAYNLELDRCEAQHGFWLDAGEAGEVRDVLLERAMGLARAQSAEANFASWKSDALKGGGGGGIRGWFRRK
jgi:Zn-finger nucleic acid-binding protein